MSQSKSAPAIALYLASFLVMGVLSCMVYISAWGLASHNRLTIVTASGERLLFLFQGLKPSPRAFLGAVPRSSTSSCQAVSATPGQPSPTFLLQDAVLRLGQGPFLILVQSGGCWGHYMDTEIRPCNQTSVDSCVYTWCYTNAGPSVAYADGCYDAGPVCPSECLAEWPCTNPDGGSGGDTGGSGWLDPFCQVDPWGPGCGYYCSPDEPCPVLPYG